MVLEKTLESPWDYKEIQPVYPKVNQSWIFIRSPIFWPHDSKNWLLGKDTDAGKDWRQEEKGMTEDQMVGWHHWLNGYEFEQALGVPDGQGSLTYCSPWGRKELDTTEWLNWTDDLTVPLLGIYPEKTIMKKGTYTPMFIAALFTIARIWKQPICPWQMNG